MGLLCEVLSYASKMLHYVPGCGVGRRGERTTGIGLLCSDGAQWLVSVVIVEREREFGGN